MSILNKFTSFYNINKRIQTELCKKTIHQLNDIQLLNEYLTTKSVKQKIQKIHQTLSKFNISKQQQNSIIQELIYDIIPAGTKGVIKGNKFNKIVKKKILNINLDPNRFIIKFETKIPIINTITEIPDWYIYDLHNNKYLIGMNQLDLWSGGHQLNRGFKYINYNNTLNNLIQHKIVCIICNDIQLQNNNNKIYHLFSQGFHNNSICYLNNLHNIINEFFNI